MPLPPQCAHEDCLREAVRDGYCNRHYLHGKARDVTMPMKWTKWDKPWGEARGVPAITIASNGSIIVSPAADVLLGQPEHIDVMVSDKPRALGFRASTGDATLTPKRKDGKPGFQFSSVIFLSHQSIDFSTSRRWRAQMLDGVLAIMLDDEPLQPMGRKPGAA